MNSTTSHGKASLWAVGLMPFMLFFDAGNLVYPAHLEQQTGENWLLAVFGFLLTGVGLPLLSVIVVGYSDSRGVEALVSCVAPQYDVAFAAALYLATGPLFTMPHTAMVSSETVTSPFIDEPWKSITLAVFSLMFSSMTYWLSISLGKLVDRIGKILAPVLLLATAILVGYAAINPMGMPQTAQGDFTAYPLVKGILKSYDTIDTLVLLVFAIIVTDAVRAAGVDNRMDLLRTATVSSVLAASCLAVAYLFIGYMDAAGMAGTGLQENGASVLSRTAQHYFGTANTVLPGVMVLLACPSTAVGLIIPYAEYFNHLCPGIFHEVFVILSMVVSILLANEGLSAILHFSIPMLVLLHPLVIVVILLTLTDKLFDGGHIVYSYIMIATLMVGLLDTYKAAFGSDADTAAAVERTLPFYNINLRWIVPSLARFILGCVLNVALKRKA